MRDETPRVTRVILWQNGMVMVFDQHGEQMPDYQGAYEDVRERLAAHLPEERWEDGHWQRRTITPRASSPP